MEYIIAILMVVLAIVSYKYHKLKESVGNLSDTLKNDDDTLKAKVDANQPK